MPPSFRDLVLGANIPLCSKPHAIALTARLDLTMRIPFLYKTRFEFRRLIFAVATKSKKSVPRKYNRQVTETSDDRAQRSLQELKRKQYNDERRKHQERLHELKLMTAEVSRQVKERIAIGEEELQRKRSLPTHSGVGCVSTTSVLTSLVELPDEIASRLGDLMRFLVNKQHQNWTMVVGHLQQCGGFVGVSNKLANRFVQLIPPKAMKSLIGIIEDMYKEAGHSPLVAVQTHFLKALAIGSVVSPQTMGVIELRLSTIRQHVGVDKPLPMSAYETMVVAYGKASELDLINAILREMKNHEIEPSSKIYTNVLSTCVYRLKDHKQAVEIFDTMRFFSKATKPGSREYRDIIVSHVNNNDVEKAIDLYHEMITDNVELNQPILVALARGCSGRPQLRTRAWEFMFEIYNKGWEPTLELYEYMIYLAAKDGDLSLSRALYSKLINSETVTVRSFGFLLLAYAKYHQSAELPCVFGVKNGRTFRNNVLKDLEITSGGVLPFLPKSDLVTTDEVMAESSAIWAYHLIKRPDVITRENVTSYLNIASEIGLLREFIDRYKSTTYLDRSGAPRNRIIAVDDQPDSENDNTAVLNSMDEVSEMNLLVKSPVLDEVDDIQRQHKVSRNSLIYVIALKAAGKHKKYDFAREIWTERGEFRKTAAFKQLPRDFKDSQDFQFANAMIYSLTQMNLLEDACAILLSTEWQFKWTWAELIHLHRASVAVGNDKIAHTVRLIAKRAQTNHAGKMRRRDYKKYVMQRGF